MAPFLTGFLSTPSARRATRYNRWTKRLHNHFYPRPPRGGRRDRHSKFKSITRFLSTPSARRATSAEAAANRAWQISIHALREEGDNSFQCSQSSRLDFYPRPPRGGRPYVAGYVTKKTYDFYPRPPRGGRQSLKARRLVGGRISIHALCEEGDHPQRGTHLVWVRFLSTPSARRATFFCYSYDCACQFLSTPSARRATRVGTDVANLFRNFYPRPLRGGRLLLHLHGKQLLHISIHALCEEGDAAAPMGCLCAKISIHALCEEGDAENLNSQT